MEVLLIILLILLVLYLFRGVIAQWMLRHFLKRASSRRTSASQSSPKQHKEKVDLGEMTKRKFDKDQGQYIDYTEINEDKTP